MSWVATAIVGSALISGVTGMAGASEAAGAAQGAQAIQQNEFNTVTAQEQPFMQTGYGALNQLDYYLGLPPSTAGGYGDNTNAPVKGEPGMPARAGGGGGGNYGGVGVAGGPGFGSLLTPFTAANWKQLSPMYNFQLQQGGQGVLNTEETNGSSLAPAALKDLISFNNQTANSSFNNAFQLYQEQQGNIYNRLSGLVQTGQNAAAQTGQTGATLAGNAGAAAVGAGNAIGTGISNAGNAIANAGNTYAWLSTLNKSPSPGG